MTRLQLIVGCSPISFQDYISNCPKAERFRRALGMTSIAHFYESTEIARWAIKELLEHLNIGLTPEMLPKLYRLGELCRDINPNLAQETGEAWKRMISSSSDPIAAFEATQRIQDQYMQAYAYYHILKKTAGEIADDPRLTTLDRLRLMNGSLNLLRYEKSHCNCHNKQYYGGCSHLQIRVQKTTDEYQWTPKAVAPLQDTYDTHTLWDLFTRSPLGIKLSDGLDASHFALSNREGANTS